MPPFPPLYHLALAPLYRLTSAPAAFLAVNWFYLAALSLAVFAIGRRLAGPGAALAAALLIGCAPETQSLLRSQLVDLPLMACAALAYWALLESDGFRRRRGSLLFAAAFAFGMLHKWSFFTYLVPAGLVWLNALRRKESRRNAFLAAALGLGAALPWYLIRLPMLTLKHFRLL